MYKLRKVLIITLTHLLISSSIFAQSPEKISYQAVIRDGSNNLVVSKEIGMRIQIVQSSVFGTAVYIETHTPTTNANGLVTIEIGEGTVVDGDFSTIDWADGPYFLKTETDPTGGTTYSISATSQLLSVPYALHAKTAETVTGGIMETDPVFTAWDKDYEDLTNKPDLSSFIATETDPVFTAWDKDYEDLTNKPDLSSFIETETDPVFTAWDKDYEDLTNKPDLSSFIETETDPLFTAWDKDYEDLTNKPDLSNFIETETDPVFTAWDKSTGILITESQISDLGTYIETEIDPTVPAHVKAITADNVSDWKEAHSWGDHSAEGYATKDMNNEKITNLEDPTNAQDAATKAYVDASVPKTYEIGDLAHGGIVFYVEPCGTKGLVAATEDQSDGVKWRGGEVQYATMARGRDIYAGYMNTSIIIAVYTAKDDIDDHAALICANYTSGGFGDWYLPSLEELDLMYNNLHTKGLGDFTETWYWSSSEVNEFSASIVNFINGGIIGNNKFLTFRVRAVRAF